MNLRFHALFWTANIGVLAVIIGVKDHELPSLRSKMPLSSWGNKYKPLIVLRNFVEQICQYTSRMNIS